MKKRITAVISLILSVFIITSVAAPGYVLAAKSKSQLQNELSETEKEQKELEAELEEKEREKSSLTKKKDEVDSKANKIATSIAGVTATIEEKESNIAAKTAEIEGLEEEIEEDNELLKKRLRVMYERGTMSYLDIIFSATSFSDLLVRIDMIQQIVRHDNELIARLGEQKAGIEEARAVIEKEKEEAESLRADLRAQKSELDALSAQSQQLIDQIESDEEELRAAIKEKEAENARILAEIRSATGGSTSGGSALSSDAKFGWPLPVAGVVTSTFGWRTLRGVPNNHTGYDVAVPTGTSVFAGESGTVISAGWKGSYGYCVIINHGALSTLYAHNSTVLVSAGQKVSKGEKIALSGSTGNSTGPHLHIGVINNATGAYLDPEPYFR